MSVHLTPTELLAGLGVLLVIGKVWRGSVRRARAARDAARAGARLFSLAGRVLAGAVLIVGVQWTVVATHPGNGWVLLGVLGLPALFSAHTLVRALTVTTVNTATVNGRGRRGDRR